MYKLYPIIPIFYFTSWKDKVLQGRERHGVSVYPLLELAGVSLVESAPGDVGVPGGAGGGGDGRADVLEDALDALKVLRERVALLGAVFDAQA